MTQPASTRLLTIVQERRQIRLDELLGDLPECTWNQVFSLVDELSRQGLLCLQRQGVDYELRATSYLFSRRLTLTFFRSDCRAACAEPFNTLSHIPIGGIFPPDPAIGFQRFCDSTQCFQRTA